MKTTVAVAAALGLFGALSVGSTAWAGSKIQSIGLTRVNGSVEFNANNNRDPFVAQVFSAGNECLRIAVVSQGADMEATLVSPSGRTWQDDDGNGALRPLLKSITDVRGWYPLVVSHFAGTAVNADFSMDVQRLPSNSASCANPTQPRIFVAPAAAKGAATFAQPRGAN